MPMIPKPMTDINSESAYEKLKFIPEHYNEIMAAYTDIMEHLKLPVEGGSGEDCLHEVVEVTNHCPAYVQFSLNVDIPLTGIHFVYKDSSGDYNVREIYSYDTNGVSSGLKDILNYLSIPVSSSYSSLDVTPILPAPSNTDLVYAAMLVDKTTGEPVEDVDIYTDIDGISGSETTYSDLTNVYDVKLVLANPNDYSAVPTILGNFLEKIVELRSNADIDAHKAKLPTPEEFGRMLNVSIEYTSPDPIGGVDTKCIPKVNIKLLTEEERTEVRKYIEMNTSSNVPPDTPYMYALDLFCHPDTINRIVCVTGSVIGSYSKGYIYTMNSFEFGRSTGCGDNHDVTYIYSTIPLTPSKFSSLYTYFVQNDASDQSTGAVVMPQTFKLIQSKEGIDRRL
jgi:hypothetical protein